MEDGLRSAQCSPSYPDRRRRQPHRGRPPLVHHQARDRRVRSARAQQPVLAPAGAPGGYDGRRRTAGPARSRRGSARTPDACRSATPAIHLSAPERVRYSYRLDGLDRDWVRAGSAPRDQLQQPGARPATASRSARSCRAARPASSRSPSRCCRIFTRPRGSACSWRRCWRVGVGRLPVAAAADPLALRAGAGGARAPGARDPRHAGAGLRRHLVAARRGGHVHAGGDHARAHVSRPGAAHGAAQPDRSAALRDGSARLGARRPGPGRRAAIRHAHVDRRLGRRRRGGRQRARAASCREDIEQHLLRIAQEAVTNALKHAGASRICDQTAHGGAQAYLRIKDNGRGFDQEDAFSSRGRPFRPDRDARARRAAGRRTAAGQPSGRRNGSEVTVPLP